jgi:Rap1a immunity proteins
MVMALCFTSSSVLAADKDDVQELYRQCKNTGAREELFCLGFIAGVTEQLMANTIMINKNDKTLDRSLFLCADPIPTFGAITQAFVKWAENHPESWSIPRQLGVMIAIQKAWPCK